MSFRRFGTGLIAAALTLTLAACSAPAATDTPAETESETAAAEEIKVLCPMGAPALATLGLEDNALVEYVEGTDLLVSELSKKDSEYDMILAPINVGVKTWSAAEAYNLDAVVTWGNLYIVSDTEDWDVSDNTLLAFGENAVPGLVLNDLMPELNCGVQWFGAVAETQQALLAGESSTALLAQPAATAAVAKAAENGTELSVVADLQAMWQEKHQTSRKGYPQAALFVKAGEEEKCAAAMEQMASFMEDPSEEEIITRIDERGVEQLGLPSAQIAAKTWGAQNLHYVKASEVKDDIAQFLAVFGMELPEGIIAE